jgi:hypothetical protein
MPTAWRGVKLLSRASSSSDGEKRSEVAAKGQVLLVMGEEKSEVAAKGKFF